MGIFKSLFGKNEPKKQNIKVEVETTPISAPKATPKQSGGGKKSKVQDLVLLYLAERYKVNETSFPEYLRYDYEIGFPKENLKTLEKKGYIRPSTAVEALPNLKLADLKPIASQFGLKVSGKKDDLVERIAGGVSEEDLSQFVKDRYWVLTDEGKALLKENPYIELYMDNHEYRLNDIGLDIFSLAKLYEQPLNGTVRDRLWSEFNRLSLEFYQKAMSKGEFYKYCELLRTMALFLKEEGRYKDALAQYCRYLHYHANFRSALSAVQSYQYFHKVNEAADTLFVNVEMMPFVASQLSSISEGCGFDSSQLKAFMIEAFSKEQDTGIFSPEELADLIMFGMNGDKEGQKNVCLKAMKATAKKMPKKKR